MDSHFDERLWTVVMPSHPPDTANDHIHGDLSPTIKLRQFKYLLRFIAILLGSIQLFTGDWTGTGMGMDTPRPQQYNIIISTKAQEDEINSIRLLMMGWPS